MRALVLSLCLLSFVVVLNGQTISGDEIKLDSLTGSYPGADAGIGVIYSRGSTGLFYNTTGGGLVTLLGMLSSDTPGNNQYPRYNSDGTVTWESFSSLTTTVGWNASSIFGLKLNNLTSEDITQSPSNGSIWYNSTTHEFRGHRNGTKRDFIMSGDGLGVNFQEGEVIVGATADDSIRGVSKQNYGRLVSSSTGDATWLSPSTGWRIDDDWISPTTGGNNGWTTFQNGDASSTIDNTNVDGNHPGIVRFSTGSLTYTAGLQLGTTILHFGGGTVVFEALINIQTLSDITGGGNEYDLYAGFGDNTTSGVHTDGVYFLYDRTTSANWQRVARSNGTESKTATGTAVSAGSWMKLKIIVNAAGTSAEYFVNGTSVGSETTNIPTGTGRDCGPVFKIVKSTGSTARTFDLDYVTVQQLFTTAR